MDNELPKRINFKEMEWQGSPYMYSNCRGLYYDKKTNRSYLLCTCVSYEGKKKYVGRLTFLFPENVEARMGPESVTVGFIRKLKKMPKEERKFYKKFIYGYHLTTYETTYNW